jgi:hypothetical protein
MSADAKGAKATLVIGCALGALLLGNAAFLILFGLRGGVVGSDLIFVNVFAIVPAVLAAALAAWMFARDRLFHRRNAVWQAVGIAVLTYAVMPLAMMLWSTLAGAVYERMETGSLPTADLLRDVPQLAVTVSAVAFLFAIVPTVLIDYLVVRRARKRLPPSVQPGVSP